MSIASFRNKSRASSVHSSRTLRSEDDDNDYTNGSRSPSRSSSRSSESELNSIKTDNRSLFSVRTQDSRVKTSQLGSNLFVKPPTVPQRKKLIQQQNEQIKDEEKKVKYHNLVLNDDTNSLLSDSTYMNSPHKNESAPIIIPIEKINKCELVIQNLLKEYNLITDQSDKELLIERILDEYIGLNTLNLLSFGDSDINYARSCYKLAEFYLEYKNYPKQAKAHCENGLNSMKKCSKNDDNNEVYMKLYYIIGRASMILKKNDDGISFLEKSLNYFKEYEKLKTDIEIIDWKKKINIAIAKQYGINKTYNSSLVHYDNAIDLIDKDNIERIGLFDDKAKIKQNQSKYDDAIKLYEDSMKIAEKNSNFERLNDCKFELAKVYTLYNDLANSYKAKELFKESIRDYKKILGKTHTKTIEAINEFTKFLIKQNDGFEDAKSLLKELIKYQKEALSDYHIDLDSSYKLLSSIYLKQNDMGNAALCLKKCIEIEELNYVSSKIIATTKESFDNLKKNPIVMQTLNIKNQSEKPKFSSVSKIDHRKHDLQIYKPIDTPENMNESKNDLNFSNISKKLAPVK